MEIFKIYSNKYWEHRKEVYISRKEAEEAIKSNPWDAEEIIEELKIETNVNAMSAEFLDELGKFIYIRTKDRMTNWGWRVKETGDSDTESNFNQIKNDELARLYAVMNSLRECDEESIYVDVYCTKDRATRLTNNK